MILCVHVLYDAITVNIDQVQTRTGDDSVRTYCLRKLCDCFVYDAANQLKFQSGCV